MGYCLRSGQKSENELPGKRFPGIHIKDTEKFMNKKMQMSCTLARCMCMCMLRYVII